MEQVRILKTTVAQYVQCRRLKHGRKETTVTTTKQSEETTQLVIRHGSSLEFDTLQCSQCQRLLDNTPEMIDALLQSSSSDPFLQAHEAYILMNLWAASSFAVPPSLPALPAPLTLSLDHRHEFALDPVSRFEVCISASLSGAGSEHAKLAFPLLSCSCGCVLTPRMPSKDILRLVTLCAPRLALFLSHTPLPLLC